MPEASAGKISERTGRIGRTFPGLRTGAEYTQENLSGMQK